MILLRHAKTEQQASSDRVRELTPHGRRDATAAGSWLRDHDLVPDLVLVSPAARALATARLACERLPVEPEIRVVEELYGASVGEALDVLTGVDDEVRRLLLVGHNPTMEDLASELQDGAGEPAAEHLPTAAIAVLRLPGVWSELGLRSAELTERYSPGD